MTEEQKQFAYTIAIKLGDMPALSLYEDFVRRIPREILEELLAKTLSIPQENIKRTRGALFTFLVKKHASTFYSRY